jgi:hypothetical protein
MEWAERQLLIYSPALAQSGYRGLEQHLKQAEAKLALPDSFARSGPRMAPKMILSRIR